MPSYDFRCLDCRKRFDVFLTYAEYGKKQVTCPHCQSTNVQRRIGRVRVARSDARRLEEIGDPSNLAHVDDDPRELARTLRQLRQESGEAVPDEFDEVVGRLEAGQSPEQIEASMPDLGAEDSAPGGGDLDDF